MGFVPRFSWSLQVRLHVVTGVIFAVAALATIALVNRQQRAAALDVSEKRANAILERNLAIHAFYAEELRPAVSRMLQQRDAEVPFDPTWMSSSYAARSIDARVPSSGAVYYYKECAIDARNPGSEADEVERAFLERARRDPGVVRWSGQRTIDGKPWFVVMRRGETIQRQCLQCHSRPELAPPGLVARYGATRGFGRREGELAAALSVRIPLEAAYAEANAFSWKLSALLVAVLLAIYAAQWTVYRRLLHRPLRTLQLGAVRLAARSTRGCRALPVPRVTELRDVTLAFNTMAASIARTTQELEAEVQARTRQLFERDAELRQAQKMEAVGRLAGGVAHDFNNLLTVIRGNADLLAVELPDGSASREEIEEIRGAAARAATLTRQLLAFSRRDVVQQRPVPVDAAIAQLARMLQRVLPANVRLSVELGAADAVVKGDAGQLEQVLLNLVFNARDAMPLGGDVRIETDRVCDGDPLARRDGASGGSWVRITVGDDGEGMDDAVLAHLFEPFFTTKPRERGTGLGLATAYGIVQQHGGRIAVESSRGAGSTFRVYFPESDAVAEDHPRVESAPRSGERGAIVLVAEDEPAVRRLVVATLRRLGHHVVAAESAEEALRISGQVARIDLLLSDLVMGGAGGHVLAERLRERRGDVPVLFMSGYAPDEQLRAQLGAAGAAFLQKPFTPDDLAARVGALLSGGARAA